MNLKDLMDPVVIQSMINDQLNKLNLGEYVEYVQYVAQGQPVPADATHVLSLTSVRSGADVKLAVKATQFYGVVADAVLAII